MALPGSANSVVSIDERGLLTGGPRVNLFQSWESFAMQWSIPALAKWFVCLLIAEWLMVPAGSRQAFMVLTGFMAVDIVTGVWAGAATGKLDSTVGRKGVSKKLATLLFLLVLHWIEHVVNIELNLELAGALGYTVNEAISIIENFAVIGVPIPSQVIAALVAAKKLRITPATDEQLRALREDSDK